MDKDLLQEEILSAWVGLNGLLKDSRMTRNMTYNEAVVMRIVLENYRRDGVGLTPVQQLVKETNMLKSQVNRTVNTLCRQGYLKRVRDEKDGRSISLVPDPQGLTDFMVIHGQSLQLAQRVIDIIGEDDARSFVRICRKLAQAGLRLPS